MRRPVPHPQVSHALLGLAWVFAVPTPTELSIKLLDEGLRLYRSVHSPSHFNISITVSALVVALESLGQFQRAQDLVRDSIHELKATIKEQKAEQRAIFRHINIRNSDQNRQWSKPPAEVTQRIAQNEAAIGYTMSRIAPLLATLGSLYVRTKAYTTAILFYKEAVDSFRQLALAKKDPQATTRIAETLFLLSCCIFDEGCRQLQGVQCPQACSNHQFKQAVVVIDHVITLYRRIRYTSSARPLMTAFKKKAAFYTEQNEPENALATYETLMKIFLETNELGYEDVALCQYEYAQLLAKYGENSEANLLLELSTEVYKKLYGERVVHHQVALNLLCKAACLIDLEQHDEAEVCIEQGLDMYRHLCDREIAFESCCHVAQLYTYQGMIHHHYEENELSEEHYLKALAVYRNANYQDSLELANVYNNLATLFDDMDKLDDSKAMYEQSIVILLRHHSKTAPEQILITLENLRNLLVDMGQHAESRSVENSIRDMERRLTAMTAAADEHKERLRQLNQVQISGESEGEYQSSSTTSTSPSTLPLIDASTLNRELFALDLDMQDVYQLRFPQQEQSSVLDKGRAASSAKRRKVPRASQTSTASSSVASSSSGSSGSANTAARSTFGQRSPLETDKG